MLPDDIKGFCSTLANRLQNPGKFLKPLIFLDYRPDFFSKLG